LLASRNNSRIAAAVESRTDRDYRDPAVIDFNRMENVPRRRVVEHRAQRHPVGQQIEIRPARDVHQEFAEWQAGAIRDANQPHERVGIIFLAPRYQRGIFTVEGEQQTADAVLARDARRSDRKTTNDGLDIHRQIASVTRRFGEAAPRVENRNRQHVARHQSARTATPLSQQSVAAEQGSISDDNYFAIVQSQFPKRRTFILSPEPSPTVRCASGLLSVK
jgi:hypothetical protein